MSRVVLFRIIGGLVVLCIVGYAAAWALTAVFGNRGGDRSAQVGEPVDRTLLTRGAYVAVLGDCAACHTAPGGKPFAGGLPIATPIGKVFTTNITPDAATGIGGYTYGDFERAVRRGILPDGTTLYPAMPYPSYARLSDADTKALYAYFMHGVKRVSALDSPAGIAWPLSMRWPLTYWRWIFAPSVQPPTDVDSEDRLLARGSYLVEGPGHCGSCHTPRGLAMQEVALTDKEGPKYLSGEVIDNFVASDLRNDPMTGLGSFREDDIVQFLKNGHTVHSAVFGRMSEVVDRSTQFMSGADLMAIAHYLKSLPASGEERAFSYDAAVANNLAAGNVSKTGALDYLNNCSACHLSSGRGYDGTFPSLAGNPVVVAKDPASVINIILKGSVLPATVRAPTDFAMPGFADRLTDQEVANLTSFIRSSWGDDAQAVSASDVAKVRKLIGAQRPTLASRDAQ